MPFLFALQTIFSLWLLTDAIKRKAECYWYWIIMMPFGEWVYFFTVKIHDSEVKAISVRLLKKPVSMTELEYAARTSPSLNNRVLLAQAKHDSEDYTESSSLFSQVLEEDTQNKKALFGLGLSKLALGKNDEALAALERLTEIDSAYRDYAACVALADTYAACSRLDDSIAILSRVQKSSNRISHSTELAKHLLAQDRKPEAQKLLGEAMEDYQNSPRYVRKAERHVAREAKRLLSAC